MTKQVMRVCIDPDPNVDIEIFRMEAADDILRLLVDAHETAFTRQHSPHRFGFEERSASPFVEGVVDVVRRGILCVARPICNVTGWGVWPPKDWTLDITVGSTSHPQHNW